MGIPVGAYGEVGYSTSLNRGYFGNASQAAQGAAYGASAVADERALEGIVGRLRAAEEASARIRSRLTSYSGGSAITTQGVPVASSPGAEVFRKRCAGCHQPGKDGGEAMTFIDAEGRWVPELVDQRPAITDAILSGSMPKNGDLEAEELQSILGWLYEQKE